MLVTYFICGFLYWIFDCILSVLKGRADGSYADYDPSSFIVSLVVVMLIWPMFFLINCYKFLGVISARLQQRKIDKIMKEDK